jgi:Zn-finger nucleic acid-binding protein
MKCPHCVTENLLDSVSVAAVPVNTCKTCGGIWFDHDELRQAKDTEVAYAKWYDFDLWENPDSFHDSPSDRLCPKDEQKLFTLAYADSEVQIDACKKCHGIWLDQSEFNKILQYVKTSADTEVLQNYFVNLAEEMKEIFTGPETFRSEVSDVLMLVDMFKYKFSVQHPKLLKVLTNVPL